MDRNVECLSVEKNARCSESGFFVALVYRSHFFHQSRCATGFQSDADFFSISRFCAGFVLVFGWVNLWLLCICMQRTFVQGPRSTKFVEFKIVETFEIIFEVELIIESKCLSGLQSLNVRFKVEGNWASIFKDNRWNSGDLLLGRFAEILLPHSMIYPTPISP